jgi:ATP-dependent DNA helicase RecG
MEYHKPQSLLQESSQFVKGVGPSRQVLLSRLGIETIEDLISHYPRKYYDRSDLCEVARIPQGAAVTFVSTVLAVSLRKLRAGRSVLTVAGGDETGIVNLVFFNQPYLEKTFRQGMKVISTGVLTLYKGQKQIVAPDYEVLSGELDQSLLHTGRIVPVYPLTAGISQRMMRRIVKSALDKCAGRIPENLPARFLASHGFPPRMEAFRQIHYPDDWEALDRARRRLKFEEVFFLHLLLGERRCNMTQQRPRPAMGPPHPMLGRFIESLPFELTAAQKRVLGEITNDLDAGSGVNRLVQGDVGCGKTIVGLAAMMMSVEKGFQAALMVPTEILAQQHYERIVSLLAGFGLNVELLIGSMKSGEKRRIHEGISSGSVDIVVGTHALIQEGIDFRQLGLAVVDEQHRFGVKQRARLGQSGMLPHFLVMTATPIPRSLAQTVYGDLDLSMIDELPIGRRNVRTEIVSSRDSGKVYEELKIQMRSGRQAFILYPLIHESEHSDLRAATEAFESLRRDELRDFPIGLLHGRMSFEEKSRAIDMFRKAEIMGLVTTTVIEVGVDIPNASILVVHNPERFGLAQLHQLRGRVGRGGDEGTCYLVLGEDAGGKSTERLKLFSVTDDGLKVAEADLRMRGPGEIWGFRQSGYPSFKLVNPLSDKALVELSWEESERLLREDPELERPQNRVVRDYLHLYYRSKMELADIG